MPAFQNVSGNLATPLFAEVVLTGQVAQSGGTSRPFVNVWHFHQTGSTPLRGVELDFAINMDNALSASLSAALHQDYTNGKFKVRFMDDPTSAYGADYGTIAGTITTDRATSFNAACLQLITSARGRNYRGSKHFGPIAEASTTQDVLNTSGLSLWNNVRAALNDIILSIDGGNTTTWEMIVLSPTLSDLEASPAIFTYAPVIDNKLNTLVGTMRHRKEKAGVV